jgi:hypothetical protein
MLRRVALVRTDDSQERISSIFRVIGIGELRTPFSFGSVLRLLVTSNVLSPLTFVTLTMEAMCFSETFVLTRATQCHIPEDDILHSHRCQNLKSYDHKSDHNLKYALEN